MGGRFTEIPQDTFEKIVVDAGVLLKKFDLYDPDYDITPDIITATTGGVQLSAQPEFSDLGEDVDNCPNDTKELKRLANWTCTIASTAVSSSPEIIQMALGAADLGDEIDVVPRAVLDLSDFRDLWWVGDRVDGGLLAVHIANALSISGITMQTGKNVKGQFGFELRAHVSIKELDRVPMTFYSMGPGAGTITGLTLADFVIQPGVPTQIPVRFVMSDGTTEEPTDYSRFTYTATLPAGGSITPDGKITLPNRGDEVTVTVTMERPGGESFTATAEASVEALRVVGIYVNGGSIVVEEGTTEQIVTEIEMSDGTIITPTDFQTGFTYTADNLPDGTSISADGVITAGNAPGTFTLTVSYTSGGNTFTDSVSVTVNAELKPLDYTTMYVMNITEPVTISGTVNAGRTRGGYTFDWGDGTRETKTLNSGATVTHDYTTPGKYSIQVKDNEGTPTSIGSYLIAGNPYVEEILIDTHNQGLSIQQPTRATNLKKVEVGVHCKGLMTWSNLSVLESIEYFYSGTDFQINTSKIQNNPVLKTVKLHASTTSKFVRSFCECPSVEVWDMSMLTAVPVMDSGSWYNIPTTMQILVPAALLNDFKTATNWSARANQFVGV